MTLPNPAPGSASVTQRDTDGPARSPSTAYLGRQPIVDRDGMLAAYELLFRSGADDFARVRDDAQATAQVVARTVGEIGVSAALGRHRGYLNISRELLLDDIVFLLPPERFVLEVLETVVFDERLIRRCQELRRAGYRFALDDVIAPSPRLIEVLPYIDVIKIDWLACERARLPELVSLLKEHGKRLVAEKIETRDDYRLALDLGVDLFQGYFFARPHVLSSRQASPSRSSLVELLALLASDRGIAELEAKLKHNPQLVMQLLRLVNSTSSGLRGPVASLREAIIAVGTRQIARWAQLLLYADDRNMPLTSDPLVQLAGTRARFMELTAARLRPDDEPFADAAFMTGIFSLLDVAFGDSLDDAVDALKLSAPIRSAIVGMRGPLGLLLRLVQAVEYGQADALCAEHVELKDFTTERLAELSLEAAAWCDTYVV